MSSKNQDSNTSSSCDDATPNNIALIEYLRNLQIDFGAVMDSVEARACFEEYLRKSHNLEAMDFIKAVDYFHSLRSSENRYKEALRIIQEFIKSGATNQINISEEVLKHTLEQFKKSSLSNCASSLFDTCFDIVLLQLRQSAFQHFTESKEFIEFARSLLQKGGRKLIEKYGTAKKHKFTKELSTPATPASPLEETMDDDDALSVNTAELLGDGQQDQEDTTLSTEIPSSKVLDEDFKQYIETKFTYFRKKETQLVDPNSTLQDVEFIQFASSDEIVPFLKPTIVCDKYQSFIYNKPMKLGKKQGLLARTQMELPFDYEKVAHVYLSKKFRELSDPNVYEMRLLDYVPASKQLGKFASFVHQEKFKLGFPYSDRYNVVSNTLVKDSNKEQYYFTRRSCKHVDKRSGMVFEDPKLTLTWFNGGGAIVKTGQNKCKVIEVYVVNLNSSLSYETVAKIFAKRIEKLYKISTAILRNEFKLDTITRIPKDGEFPLAKMVLENKDLHF